MPCRTFTPLKLLGLLSLTSVLGACTSVPVDDVGIEGATPQPLLSDVNCNCGFSSLGVAQPKTDLQAVYFDTAKANLRPDAQSRLDAIANAIRFNNPTSVVIEGNADSRGKDGYNKNLAQKRAKAVRQGLIKRGIAADLLVIQSNGERRPVAPNMSPQGMQLNRRVDVTLYLR